MSSNSRMLPGQRMAAFSGLKLVLDNAKDISRTAQHCDLAQPTQVKRFSSLSDLHNQQLEKAVELRRHMNDDALSRKQNQSMVNVRGQSRVAADTKQAGSWVANKKHHERKRVINHERNMVAEDPADVHLALTVYVNVALSDTLCVECFSIDGELRWHKTAPTTTQFSEIKQDLAKRFKMHTIKLVTPGGADITNLRRSMLVKDIPAWDAAGDFAGDCDDEYEVLPERMVRDMHRKRPNSSQRQRMNGNRDTNKRARRDETEKVSSASSMASPTRSVFASCHNSKRVSTFLMPTPKAAGMSSKASIHTRSKALSVTSSPILAKATALKPPSAVNCTRPIGARPSTPKAAPSGARM